MQGIEKFVELPQVTPVLEHLQPIDRWFFEETRSVVEHQGVKWLPCAVIYASAICTWNGEVGEPSNDDWAHYVFRARSCAQSVHGCLPKLRSTTTACSLFRTRTGQVWVHGPAWPCEACAATRPQCGPLAWYSQGCFCQGGFYKTSPKNGDRSYHRRIAGRW